MQERTNNQNEVPHQDLTQQSLTRDTTLDPLTTPPLSTSPNLDQVVATAAVAINYKKLAPNFPIKDGILTITEDTLVFASFTTAPSEMTIIRLGELGLEVPYVSKRTVLIGTLKKEADIASILTIPELRKITHGQKLSPL